MGWQHWLFLARRLWFGFGFRLWFRLRFRFRLRLWFRLRLGFWFRLRFRFWFRFRFGFRLRCKGSPLGHKFQNYRGTSLLRQFQRRGRAGGKVHNTAFCRRNTARNLDIDLFTVTGVCYPYLGSKG
jgi:hypothetical protein